MPTSFPAELLLITDGTTTFDLMNRGNAGFWCYNWVPAVAEPKGGGSWRDSPLAEGRTPAYRQFGNVIDTFDISATGATQDVLARDIGKLRYLLENAVKYWVSNQPSKHVWLVARGVGETNTRYATIIDYRTPSDGNPYDDPWAKLTSPRSAIDPWSLTIEHSHWMEEPPGTGTCVQASAEQEDWHYEPEWNLNSNQPVDFVLCLRWFEECGYLYAGSMSVVWRTNNPAVLNNWTSHVTAAGRYTYDVLRARDGTLYAGVWWTVGGLGYIYRSTDCGNTWAIFTLGGADRGTATTNSMVMGADDRVYFASNFGIPPQGYVYSFPLVGAAAFTVEATDTTWSVGHSLIELGADTAAPGRQVLSIENTNLDGEIWITDDYWTTRRRTWTISGEVVSSLFCTSSGLILAGTTSDLIYCSIDGITWTSIVAAGDVGGFGISGFAENDEGIICSSTYKQTYLISADGGLTWDERVVSTSDDYTVAVCWSNAYGWFISEQDDATAFGRIYALDNITTVGRSATCEDEVFVVNHRSELNLTHVKVYDASAAPPNDYTDEFPAAAFSFDLLPPGGTAVGDAVYFGIDTALQPQGNPPHDNLIFDIDTPAYDQSLRWEYYNGAWATLTVHDGTDAGMGPLTRSGVSPISWVPPSDWTTVAVDGTTALWVRCYVYGAPGADETIPTQQNRDVYTTIWPRTDIAATQVPGTIMALGRHLLTMRSDEDGLSGEMPDLWANRVIMGLRKMERGGVDCRDFTAYLNCSDEQNPPGIACSLGTSTVFVDYLDHAPGRVAQYYPLGVQSMAMRVRFELEGELARQYHGSYHAFMRIRQLNATFGTITFRLYIGSPWGSNEYWTNIKTISGTDEYTKLIDLGPVDLPQARLLKPDEYPGTTRLEIHAACTDMTTGVLKTLGDWMASDILAPYDTAVEAGVNPTDFEHWTTAQLWYDGIAGIAEAPILHFLDLILIPTDEWYGNFTDDVLSTTTALKNGYYFDLDGIENPREKLRPLVFNAATGAEMAIYEPQSPGPVLLNPQEQQRMWYLFDRSTTSGTATWDASPHILLSTRIERMARYLGMRGDQ